MKHNLIEENEIKLLNFPQNIKSAPGMYISTVSNADVILRETIDNSTDESQVCPSCDTIIIEQNFNNFFLVCDNGRGIPIKLSHDVEGIRTQTDVAVTSIHAGSKFSGKSQALAGVHGTGSACVNALSQRYLVLSKVTEDNYNTSLPVVKEVWESLGPRQRKDLYYFIEFEKGYKVNEGAERIGDIEKRLFGSYPTYTEFPKNMSTLVLFQPDPDIFESCIARVPKRNLEYFTLIQEKFYNKKVNVIINGEKLRDSIKPYQFEFTKTIIPADTSKNPSIPVYCTFEPMDDLSSQDFDGSINGLFVQSGAHIQYIQKAFEAALVSEYKLPKGNKYLSNGIRMLIIMLVPDPIYSSQSKESLRNINKVKASDFEPIAKEFIKHFRKNSDIWSEHVSKLEGFLDSMKSFTAKEKSLKMINTSRGVGFYKSRVDIKGFAEATSSDRMNCELFLCLPAEQEVLLVNNNGDEYTLPIGNIVEQFESSAGEIPELYTYSSTGTGKSRKTRIIGAKKTRETWEIVKITLSDNTTFRCTPNHKIRLEGGEYKEAGSLLATDKVMMREGEGKSGVTPSIIQWENHKEPIPVFCLEVQDKEHNFPLSNGIVVKNSEGISAGSSLINGRHDTKYHAVLSLRGKVLNISDKDEAAALDNKEIGAIFKLLNLGTSAASVFDECKTPEEVEKALIKHANYGKIVISTD